LSFATPVEINRPQRGWKKDRPIYVRVHHAEFVSGTLENGFRLNNLLVCVGMENKTSVLKFAFMQFISTAICFSKSSRNGYCQCALHFFITGSSQSRWISVC